MTVTRRGTAAYRTGIERESLLSNLRKQRGLDEPSHKPLIANTCLEKAMIGREFGSSFPKDACAVTAPGETK
jgi:hypothetical protein